MSPLLVTVDTGPWIDLLNQSGSEMERILWWHRSGYIRLFASSRVFDPDTDSMDPHQQIQLRSILRTAGVEIVGAGFRTGISRIMGPDVIESSKGVRSDDDWKRFTEIVGPDPSALPPNNIGRAMKRKVGDYDALYMHFGLGFDVFLTLDTKDYLHISRRGRYGREINLIIQAPCEFISTYTTVFSTL